jgi:hypothetical protein
MRHRRMIIAGAVVTAVALSGCGQSAQVKLQQREIAYQDRLAQIDKPFLQPTTDPSSAVSKLRRAIRQYEALNPPGRVRRLNAEVTRGLEGELRAYEVALSKTASTRQIHVAEALGARSRLTVSKALVQMGKIIGSCRSNAADC